MTQNHRSRKKKKIKTPSWSKFNEFKQLQGKIQQKTELVPRLTERQQMAILLKERSVRTDNDPMESSSPEHSDGFDEFQSTFATSAVNEMESVKDTNFQSLVSEGDTSLVSGPGVSEVNIAPVPKITPTKPKNRILYKQRPQHLLQADRDIELQLAREKSHLRDSIVKELSLFHTKRVVPTIPFEMKQLCDYFSFNRIFCVSLSAFKDLAIRVSFRSAQEYLSQLAKEFSMTLSEVEYIYNTIIEFNEKLQKCFDKLRSDMHRAYSNYVSNLMALKFAYIEHVFEFVRNHEFILYELLHQFVFDFYNDVCIAVSKLKVKLSLIQS